MNPIDIKLSLHEIKESLEEIDRFCDPLEEYIYTRELPKNHLSVQQYRLITNFLLIQDEQHKLIKFLLDKVSKVDTEETK